jgi:hypothetical protein
MDCQICFETFPELYKVNCDSPVDHLICFGCEKNWREKMPVRDGKRKMTCPTCRQEETSRAVESLERELASLYVSRQAHVSVDDAVQAISRLGPAARSFVAHHILSTVNSTAVAAGAAAAGVWHRGGGADAAVAAGEAAAGLPPRSSTRPPPRVLCESGRVCVTRSQVNPRTKTHLKCRRCKVVPCCARCDTCTTCRPLVPSS